MIARGLTLGQVLMDLPRDTSIAGNPIAYHALNIDGNSACLQLYDNEGPGGGGRLEVGHLAAAGQTGRGLISRAGTPNRNFFFGVEDDRLVAITQNGQTFWAFQGSANAQSLYCNLDNSQDIANSGARLRSIYVGTAFRHSGSNGQFLDILQKSELTSVANGVLTQASTITIPTNAVVLAVSSLVTVQPGGTTTYKVTGTSSTTQFSTSATVSTVAGTSDAGTKNCPFYDAQVNETVTYTFDAGTTDALGRIRTVIYYYLSTPPTS